MSTIIVSIPGIHCDACKKLIEEVSKEKFPDVEVEVDTNSKQVTLKGKDVDKDKWCAAIEEKLGDTYKVQPVF